jgi:hypothetical protein
LSFSSLPKHAKKAMKNIMHMKKNIITKKVEEANRRGSIEHQVEL